MLEEEPLQASGLLPQACRAGLRPEKLHFSRPHCSFSPGLPVSLPSLPPVYPWSFSVSRLHTPGILL